jgi:hypothetical protein
MAILNKTDIPLKLAVYFTYLKDHGVRYIRAEFNGGGDSGGVEEITTYHISEIDEDFEDNSTTDSYRPDDMPDVTHGDNWNMIENLALQYSKSYDWWNNDGGYGYFILDIVSLEYKTEYNIYTTSTDTFTEDGYLEF